MNRSFALVSIAFVVLLTDTITPLAGLQGFDFGLTVNPSNSVTGVGGQALTAAVSVSQISGNASVIVGLLGPPGAFLSTTENQPPPFSITLTVTPPSTTGTYTWTITACESGGITCLNGGVTHSATYTLLVSGPDFNIAPSIPISVSCVTGSACTSSVTLTALYGFSGNVALTVSSSTPAGLNCGQIAVVTLPPSSNAVLSCSANTPGDYAVTVTGSSGSLSHTTASISFQVASAPDFVASAPASLDFISGTTDTSTISLTSQNGFAGTVTIQTQVTPSTGLGVSCNPNGVALGATASTVCTFDSSSPGIYEVAVTETSGSISHTTAITVTVEQARADLTVDFVRSNSLWLVIGIVGVGVAAAGIVLRKKKGGRTKEPERLGTMPPQT